MRSQKRIITPPPFQETPTLKRKIKEVFINKDPEKTRKSISLFLPLINPL
jgi:hypothetical protein